MLFQQHIPKLPRYFWFVFFPKWQYLTRLWCKCSISHLSPTWWSFCWIWLLHRNPHSNLNTLIYVQFADLSSFAPVDTNVSKKPLFCNIHIHLSQYLTNLMHKICFTISFISYLYMIRTHVLIIRRSKLHYTTSSVLSQAVHETATYRCDDTRGCVMQFWPPDDGHMCSNHVEAWNKAIFETNFVHQVG